MSNSSEREASSPPWSPPPPSPQPVALSDQQYLVPDNQVLVSLYVNAIWGGLCLLGFIVLRGWVRGPGGVFQRRQELQDLFMRPPWLRLGTFRQIWNWLMPLLAVSDADIVRCCGYDALILTRVLLIGLQLFTVMTFFGMIVLIPAYYTRGGLEASTASLGTLARLSVANIPTGSSLYVLPFAMTYVFIGYGCWVLLINCKCYAQLRMAYFTCLDALPTTLEVEVPPDAAPSAGPAPAPAPALTAAESAADRSAAGSKDRSVVELPSLRGAASAAPPPPAVSALPEAPAAHALAEAVQGPSDERMNSSEVQKCLERTQDCSQGGPMRQPSAPQGPPASKMWLRSTWVNMVNFFNPTLRMMLDHLDWQNPLQRTAACFGVQGLKLPSVYADEVEKRVRLYNEPLLEYDNLVSKKLRGDAEEAFGSGSDGRDNHGDDGGGGDGGGGDGGGGESSSPGTSVSSGHSTAAVLPYWRPVAALRQMRDVCALRASSGADRAVPLVPASSSFARHRKGTATAVSAVEPGTGERGVGSGDSASVAAPRASLQPSYTLRHCTTAKLGAVANAPAAVAAMSAAQACGMPDPRQPLLPGKRNVRLLQLLQVPMRLGEGLDGAAGGDAGGGGFGARRAHVHCRVKSSGHHVGGGGGASASAAELGSCDKDEDGDPIRLVNAGHYVVLIKRVHCKRGPDVFDRMAALSYMILSHVRAAALWATKDINGHTNAGVNRVSTVADSAVTSLRAAVAAASTATGMSYNPYNPPTAGGSASLGTGSQLQRVNTATTAQRSVREVEAQAVAVAAAAAAAAAAATELRGVAKAAHEVQRFYEMFDDPGRRLYDPLKDVCATDLRSKPAKATRRSTAGGGGEAGGAFESNTGGDGTAVTDEDCAAAAKLPLSVQRSMGGAGAAPAEPDAAAAAAAAAAADAELDPNGASVAAVLRDLFPKSFQGLMPVTNHDAVDKLIHRWDAKMLTLANVVRDLEVMEARQHRRQDVYRHEQTSNDVERGKVAAAAEAPQAQSSGGDGDGGWFRCGGGGDGDASAAKAEKLHQRIAKLRRQIHELESKITSARASALQTPSGTAYFAMFSNSQDAQMLAQCRRVMPPQGPGTLLSFDAVPAPAPDDVNWPALWSTGSLELGLRRLAILLPMAAIFALPFGPLQGALASLDVSLCGGGTTFEGINTNKLYVDWFCEPQNMGVQLSKMLITGVLPSVLGLVWTSLAMPQLLYLCSSLARSETSLSGQERQMQNWFFWYSLINTFLGAVLGSGVFSQLGTYLSSPQKLLDKVGRALPSTANFFIQFCIARAIFTNTIRLLWPHAGSMVGAIFRSVLRLGVPRSLHAAALVHMLPSTRSATYYNAILQVFMFGCAFAVVSPIILPCCWLFFLTGFFTYRYSILYTYERSYESGGRMWPVLFDQIMGFLVLMEVFSGAVFIVNESWLFAGIIWCTLTPPLLIFWRYCTRFYLEPLHFPPLSVVATEPRGVRLSPLVYVPPALRPGALGWYPEQGKVWEKYGIPKHY